MRESLLGESLMGESLVGESLMGESLVGESLVEESLMRESLMKESLMRESLMKESLVGESLVGESLVKESLMGESLVGESLVGESFVGESFVGESFVGDESLAGHDFFVDDESFLRSHSTQKSLKSTAFLACLHHGHTQVLASPDGLDVIVYDYLDRNQAQRSDIKLSMRKSRSINVHTSQTTLFFGEANRAVGNEANSKAEPSSE
jgi:hypothetical protein